MRMNSIRLMTLKRQQYRIDFKLKGKKEIQKKMRRERENENEKKKKTDEDGTQSHFHIFSGGYVRLRRNTNTFRRWRGEGGSSVFVRNKQAQADRQENGIGKESQWCLSVCLLPPS